MSHRGDPRLPTADQIERTGLKDWATRLVLRLYERLRDVDDDVHNLEPQIHIDSFTRDLTTASGTQQVSGIGFATRKVTFLYGIAGTGTGGIGIDDGTSHFTWFANDTAVVNTYGINANESIAAITGVGTSQRASITSTDADSFTLTWVKAGAPTGTLTVCYCAER